MITIQVINLQGHTGELRVAKILTIDGEPYPPVALLPSVKELVDRLTIVESLIATVIGDTSFQPQPLPEHSSAE